MRLFSRLCVWLVLLLLLLGCTDTPRAPQEATAPPQPTATSARMPSAVLPTPASPWPTLVAPTAALPPVPASPTTSAPACPVTAANGNTPPWERPGARYHGNGDLDTVLWPDGLVRVPAEGVAPDGALAMAFFWWRGLGVPPLTAVEGRRLDAASAPLRAEIPQGYDLAASQPATLVFPAPGCREVTGTAGTARLTFVTRVAA